jgi:hypothetical protein
MLKKEDLCNALFSPLLISMKSSSRRILYRIVLPGIALTFFACQQARKHPLGQWPVKPAGISYARYEEGAPRRVQLRLRINGARWSGLVNYRGAEVKRIEVTESTDSALANVLAAHLGDCVTVPLLPNDDTSSVLDMSESWVSRDFEQGGRIIAEDLNFDGRPDLVLYNAMQSTPAQGIYDVWLYDGKTHRYNPWNLGSTTGGSLFAIDKKHRRLQVARAGQQLATYKVVGDSGLQLVKVISEL